MDNFRSLSAEEKLKCVTDELKKRVAEDGRTVIAADTTNALKELKAMYPDLPVQTMGTWTKNVLNKDAFIYLIEQGIAKSVREACLERVEYVDSINMKKARFLLEQYDSELVDLMQKSKTTILNNEMCPWLLTDYYFIIDAEEQSPFAGGFWKMRSLVDSANRIKIISKANMLELFEKKEEKGKQHQDLFIAESRDKKLKRAMKLFESSVKKVEQYLDKTHDYNYPTVSTHSNLTGFVVKAEVTPDCADDFFDAAVEWMNKNDKGYDFNIQPANIRKWYAESYEKFLNGEFWFNGEIGVRYPVGLAVAVIIYADPSANIEIEYVRDKWEFRGDYNASKRVCLEIADYGYDVKVHYNKYDAYDM